MNLEENNNHRFIETDDNFNNKIKFQNNTIGNSNLNLNTQPNINERIKTNIANINTLVNMTNEDYCKNDIKNTYIAKNQAALNNNNQINNPVL